MRSQGGVFLVFVNGRGKVVDEGFKIMDQKIILDYQT